MTEIEIAWAAGLFEGEGCIEISGKNRSRTGVRLYVVMADKDVLERFEAIAGCGTIRLLRAPSILKPHWKPVWRWTTGQAAECRRLLGLWSPYLGDRRTKKAAEAVALLDEKESALHKVCLCGSPFRAEHHWQIY